jgi:hypothetical protein
MSPWVLGTNSFYPPPPLSFCGNLGLYLLDVLKRVEGQVGGAQDLLQRARSAARRDALTYADVRALRDAIETVAINLRKSRQPILARELAPAFREVRELQRSIRPE